MNITLMSLIVAFTSGLTLGAANLTALWLVLRRLPTVRHPTLWLMTSAAVRMAAILLGFYWIMDGRWQLLLACLLGFIAVRVVVTSRVRTARPKRALPL